MSKEGYPVNGIETYYKDPTFHYLEDNNRVPIEGAFFHTFIPPESMEEIQAIGLANSERVIFTETSKKKLPEALKNGEMCLSDLWSVLVAGPDFQGG